MSLATIYTTPLLKVPLLVSTAFCTYQGMTPPNPPPALSEQKRFAKDDFMTKTTDIWLKVTIAVKAALCGVSLIEAAVLLAQQYPDHPLSKELFSTLLPAALHSSPLRLTALSAAGCVLGTLGGFLRMLSHRELGRFFTWQVAVRDGHKLITTGPYAYVQHPGYIAWALMATGNTMLLLSKGSFVKESGIWSSPYGRATTSALIGYIGWIGWSLLTRMRKECDVLHAQFGAEWEAYNMRTPYWLIPYVY